MHIDSLLFLVKYMAKIVARKLISEMNVVTQEPTSFVFMVVTQEPTIRKFHMLLHISHVVTHILHVVTHVFYMLLLLYVKSWKYSLLKIHH